MKFRIAALFLSGLTASAYSSAKATTIDYSGFIQSTENVTAGNGFGTTFTVITTKSNTSPESACVAPSGVSLTFGSTACGGEKSNNGAGTTVVGGNEENGAQKQAAPTTGQLGTVDASQLAFIFNSGDPQGTALDLQDLAIKVYDPTTDALLLTIADAFNPIYPEGGQGQSGNLFLLSASGVSELNPYMSGNYILSMDLQVGFPTNGSGSSESITLTTLPNVVLTPEPSSLVLLGTGIVGAAGLLRRRLVNA